MKSDTKSIKFIATVGEKGQISCVSFSLEHYKSRLDIVAKAIERFFMEIYLEESENNFKSPLRIKVEESSEVI